MGRHDVTVVGSLNRDVRTRLTRLPSPGETVLARESSAANGGKGGNQAVAASCAGARVAMVGAVGDDAAGASQLAELAAYAVDVTGIATVGAAATGGANIYVADSGENSIVVTPGANARVDLSTLSADELGVVVVVQGEIPAAAIEHTARLAASAGSRLVLNLAPVIELPPGVLATADPLVVNASEAEALVGRHGLSGEELTAAVAATCRPRSTVVTLGREGSVVLDATGSHRVPTAAVREVVDSTGAGDTFVGALAAHLAQGVTLLGAARLASVAASASVTWEGARPPRGAS